MRLNDEKLVLMIFRRRAQDDDDFFLYSEFKVGESHE